jgi:NAD kinase
VVRVTVENEAGGMLSVDGFVDRAIAVGTTVQVETSELNARFLRKHPPASFYGSLTRRLGMRMEAMTRDREEVRGNLNDESP